MFLLRHAEAAPGFPDAGRALTEHGRGQIAKLAEALDWSCLSEIRRVEHSGFVRARQTAEDLVSQAALKRPVMILSGLRPMDDPRIVIPDLSTCREDRLLVGHNPHLARLAGALLGSGLIEVPIVVRKCGLLALERVDVGTKQRPIGRWRLLWMVSPGRFSKDGE